MGDVDISKGSHFWHPLQDSSQKSKSKSVIMVPRQELRQMSLDLANYLGYNPEKAQIGTDIWLDHKRYPVKCFRKIKKVTIAYNNANKNEIQNFFPSFPKPQPWSLVSTPLLPNVSNTEIL
jgi:hypothetical protein